MVKYNLHIYKTITIIYNIISNNKIISNCSYRFVNNINNNTNNNRNCNDNNLTIQFINVSKYLTATKDIDWIN